MYGCEIRFKANGFVSKTLPKRKPGMCVTCRGLAITLFTLSLTKPSPKLPSPVWPWPGEPSDLHWLGKPCIVGEISHLHLV